MAILTSFPFSFLATHAEPGDDLHESSGLLPQKEVYFNRIGWFR
jgi:hypothetical protein